MQHRRSTINLDLFFWHLERFFFFANYLAISHFMHLLHYGKVKKFKLCLGAIYYAFVKIPEISFKVTN
jgi:hypothetical protein